MMGWRCLRLGWGRCVFATVECRVDADPEMQEFADLREDMRAQGLEVREYVAQATAVRFKKPSYQATLGKRGGGGGVKLIDKCLETVNGLIEHNWPYDTCEYGLLAAQNDVLAIARVPEEDCYGTTLTIKEPVLGRPILCNVIGRIQDGEATFTCEDAEAKKFFDSLGKLKGAFVKIDAVQEALDAAALKAKEEKKKAKKHRRNLTQTTITDTATTTSQTWSEVAKMSKSASLRAKRKRQHARRAEEGVVITTTITLCNSDAGDGDGSGLPMISAGHPEVEPEGTITDAEVGDFVFQDKDGNTILIPGLYVKTGDQKNVANRDSGNGGVDEESANSSSDESAATVTPGPEHGVEVVQINKWNEDSKKVLQERAGRPIIFAWPNEEGYGFKHVGRGL